MSETELPATVAELRSRMNEGWIALNEALLHFDEASMTAEDPESGWSIKDHLSHLAAWEAGIVEVLRHGNRAAGMGVTDEEWAALTMNQTNEVIYERNKLRSLSDVRTHFKNVHADMTALVGVMSDEDLYRSYSYFQPDEADDSTGEPIINWIVGDTYDHFAEHLNYLEGKLSAAK